MLKAIESVLAVLLAVGIYGGVPALMFWGWARWFTRTQSRTLPVILSLIGFALATASACWRFPLCCGHTRLVGFPITIHGC